MMQPEMFQLFLQQDLDHQEVFQLFLQQDLDHQAGLYGPKMGNYACDDYTQVLLPVHNISQHVEGFEEISGLDEVLRWWVESEEMENNADFFSLENESPFSREKSMDIPVANVLPLEDMEVEGQTSLCNLLEAYGEAMEMGQRELANVIVGCINAKTSPFGATMKRVAFNLFHSGNQVDFIKQESMKNFKSAFKAFYQIFPYGRFCHFAANSAIVEAIMSYSGKLHIIDFDMGEGVQWAAMLEVIEKLKRDIKLTSIRTNEQNYNFEETRNRLLDYANGCGLNLEVQDVRIEDLAWEIERSREHEHEFLTFNCMVGLPHMGRIRSRSEVMQFITTAKKLLLTHKGIITFGDGEYLERRKDCNGFGSYFGDCIMHYHALCESMEISFPENLKEARVAMESLFVWPYVTLSYWYKMWENVKGGYGFKEITGLVGWRLSKESLMEAKEMVKKTHSSYNIRVEGQNNNEMVLEWRGTPLVRISVWK
ncbi:hypothetical protein SSX86_025995 [Deinandra increscens subsp. villosa]|uniref:Nodulation signaling pathway 2-like protein n=1 Tax=Deinandra increscens subsp. villosa TaxID=3103831 RepID=A0AAP0GMP9_9ASTR